MEVAPRGGELCWIDVKRSFVESTLGHVGVGGRMETLSSVGGDESAISGDVSRPRGGGVLHLIVLTGEW